MLFKITINLFLALMLSACTKPMSNNLVPQADSGSEFVMTLAPSTIILDQSGSEVSAIGSDLSNLIQWDDVYINKKASKRIFIEAKNDITNLDINSFKQMENFVFKFSTCGTTLKRLRACVVDMEFSPHASVTSIAEEVAFTPNSSFIFGINTISSGPTPPSPAIQVNTAPFNLGDFFVTRASSRITISNFTKTLMPVTITPSSFTNSDFSYRSYCPAMLALGSCQIEISYYSTVSLAIDTVKTTSLTVSGHTVPISVTHKIALSQFPLIPTKSTSNLVTLTQPEVKEGVITFVNSTNIEFKGPIQVQTSSPGIKVTFLSCPDLLKTKRICTIKYSLDSMSLPIGASVQELVLKNNFSHSEKFYIPIEVAFNGSAFGNPPATYDPGTGMVTITLGPPDAGFPADELPQSPTVTFPYEEYKNCPVGSSLDLDTHECTEDNYALRTFFNDNSLSESVSLTIYKNNVLCEDECLETFKTDDKARIIIDSNDFTYVKKITLAGDRTGEYASKSDVSFQFTHDDIHVTFNLAVGGGSSTEIPPTPIDVPSSNGGNASIRCYTFENMMVLNATEKVQDNAEIPSLIISAAMPESVDIATVNNNDHPKYYGFTRKDGELLQCYNFSNSSVPSTQSCIDRLHAANIYNDSLCQSRPTRPGEQVSVDPSVETCYRFGVGCGGIKVNIPDSVDQAIRDIHSFVKGRLNIKTCTPGITCWLGKWGKTCKKYGSRWTGYYKICWPKFTAPGCTVKTCVDMPKIKLNSNKITNGLNQLSKVITSCAQSNACGDVMNVLQNTFNEVTKANKEVVAIVTSTSGQIDYNHLNDAIKNATENSFSAAKILHNQAVSVGTQANTLGVGPLGDLHSNFVNSAAVINQQAVDQIKNNNLDLIGTMKTLYAEVITPAINTGSYIAMITKEVLASAATVLSNNLDEAFDAAKSVLSNTFTNGKIIVGQAGDNLGTSFDNSLRELKESAAANNMSIADFTSAAKVLYDQSLDQVANLSTNGANTFNTAYNQSVSNAQTLNDQATGAFSDLHQNAVTTIADLGLPQPDLQSSLDSSLNSFNTFATNLKNGSDLAFRDLNNAISNSRMRCETYGTCGLSTKFNWDGGFSLGNIFGSECDAFCQIAKLFKRKEVLCKSVQKCTEDPSFIYEDSTLSIYSLNITYDNSTLAQKLENPIIYKNGEHCTGTCLSKFKPGDIAIVFIDSYGPDIQDIRGNVAFMDIQLFNGVAFVFEDHNITLNVILGGGDSTIPTWNAGDLATQSRYCAPQPTNSQGGYETSLDDFLTTSGCKSFTCINNSIYNSATNSCVPQNCQISDVPHATAVSGNAGSCIAVSCATNYQVSNNLCELIPCSASQTRVGEACVENNYSLSIAYSNPALATDVSSLVIYKNNVICSSSCLNTFHSGDEAKIIATPNTYIDIPGFSESGSISNKVTSLNQVVFNFTNTNVEETVMLDSKPFVVTQQPSVGISPISTIVGTVIGTKNSSLTLTTSNPTVARQMLISTSSNCSTGNYVPFQASVGFTLANLNGSNFFSVKYANGDKFSNCFSYTINHDNIAPVVTNTNVAPLYSNGGNFTLTGACDSNLALTFTESTKTQASTCNSGTYSYSYSPSLISNEGSITILISQTDASGNTGMASFAYILDKTAPTGTISGNEFTNNSFESPNFTINISDANLNTATLTMGESAGDTSLTNAQVLPSASTTFQSTISNGKLKKLLAPGKTYYAAVTAVDKAGNSSVILSNQWFYGIVPIKVSEVAPGFVGVCALLTNGTVKCWGSGNGLGMTYPANFRLSSPPEATLDFGGNLIKSIKNGSDHFCAVTTANQLYCWGDNTGGQLGLGVTTSLRVFPSLVDIGPYTIKKISLGSFYSCAIFNNDQAKCWGTGTSGQLGYGSVTSSGKTETVAQIPFINFGAGITVKDIMATGGFTCAVLSNNEMKCWGTNGGGQLGQGDYLDYTLVTPAALPAINLGSNFIPDRLPQTAVGASNTCVISNLNQVKCWGSNSSFSTGYDTSATKLNAPSSLGVLNFGAGITVREMTVHGWRECATLSNNTAKCWGANPKGELGLGYATPTPSEDKKLSQTSAINLGSQLVVDKIYHGYPTTAESYLCAITTTNLLKCWGENFTSRLGTGDNDDKGITANGTWGDDLQTIRTRPNLTITQNQIYSNNSTNVLSGYCIPSKVVTFTEQFSGKTQTVMCSATGDYTYTYVPDNGLSEGVTRVEVSQNTDYGDIGSYVVKMLVDKSNPIASLTGNFYTTDPNYLPQHYFTATDASFSGGKNVQIKVGTAVGDGSLYTSGATAMYTGAYFEPEGIYASVVTSAPWDLPSTLWSSLVATFQPSIKNVSDASINNLVTNLNNVQPNTTYYTTMTFTDSVNLTTTISKSWQYIPGYSPLQKDKAPVANGKNHSCAVIENVNGPRVYCWGSNSNGQIGQNTLATATYLTPRVVTNGTNWNSKSVATGNNHSCAIVNDLTDAISGDVIKCWGLNSSGQLGTGNNTQLLAAGTISANFNLLTPKSIYAQGDFTCAIMNDSVNDALYCWGSNANGELGIGSTIAKNTPQLVSLGSGLTPKMVSTGVNHVCVILTNNTLKCWGKNDNGQLGDGTYVNKGDTAATTPDLLPTVSLPNSVKILATGADHTCVLLSTDAVRCWGNNLNGQLGVSKATAKYNSPQTVTIPGNAPKFIVGGGQRTCIMTIKNSIECVGINTYGDLGSATNVANKDAYTGTGIASWGNAYLLPKYMSLGESHGCAFFVGHRMKCWGRNDLGQLGTNNNNTIGLTPASMADSTATGWPYTASSIYIRYTADEIP